MTTKKDTTGTATVTIPTGTATVTIPTSASTTTTATVTIPSPESSTVTTGAPLTTTELLEPADPVSRAIAEVQADKDFVHRSAEHLEIRVVRKLLVWGYEITKAEYDARMRLY